MTPQTKLTLVPSKIIPLDNLHLLLRPSTGDWLILNRNGLDIAQSLTGNQNTAQVVHRWSESFPVREVSKVLEGLTEHGFLEDTGSQPAAAPAANLPTLVVLHLTQECNLACKYCYVDAGEHFGSDRTNRRMSLPTALRVIDEMLSLHRNTGKQIRVLFHGGEPLLNFDVIRAVVERAAANGNITFEIQTNAALLNAERIQFLKDHGVGVGVSIDGPEAVHDATRFSRDGSGSYHAVLRGVELLRAAGLSVGVLVVLTRANVQQVASTFDLLLRLGIRSFSFNPLFLAGRGGKNKELALSGDELFLAYRVLASKIIEHNRKCEVEERVEERTLKYVMHNMVRRDAAFMCMRTPCGAGTETLSVDTNGDICVCDDFLHQPDFVLGNIHDGSLAQMLKDSPQVKQFSERSIAADPKCGACDWRMLCGGICPAHSYYEGQTATEERPECRLRQKMIPHLFQLLAWGQASPDLFDRQPQKTGGREFYFNINYRCNSRCVFCASDLTRAHTDHPELDVATFNALLKLNQVRKGDSVIVNGGEPTMTKHLPELLSSVAGTGAHSHLFTNGRRLSQPAYCQRILSTGVKKISIPIFGCEPEAHDRLTGIQGSFAQTVAGIAAICECRARLAPLLTLELKLLFFKPTLQLNASILKWIAREFPVVDCVSLNGLIVSKVVFGQWDELVATPAELRQSLNATLDVARSGGFESLIGIHDIPYCLIDKSNCRFLPPVTQGLDYSSRHYFDPQCLGGKSDSVEPSSVPPICEPCAYVEQCSFIRRPYFDRWVAQQSMRAMFSTQLNCS